MSEPDKDTVVDLCLLVLSSFCQERYKTRTQDFFKYGIYPPSGACIACFLHDEPVSIEHPTFCLFKNTGEKDNSSKLIWALLGDPADCRARWYLQCDNDTITDADNLLVALDASYSHRDPVCLLSGRNTDLISGCQTVLRRHGFGRWFGGASDLSASPYGVPLFTHSYGSTVLSREAFIRMRDYMSKNTTVREALRTSAGTVFCDQIISVIARMAGVPVCECSFLSTHCHMEAFSGIARDGQFHHLHYFHHKMAGWENAKALIDSGKIFPRSSVAAIMKAPHTEALNLIKKEQAGGALSDLFTKFGSDKHSRHRYATTYERLLQDMRDKDTRLLEVGIGSPALSSLKTWRDWLPKAAVFGVDVNAYKSDDQRITCFTYDAAGEEFHNKLKSMKEPHFDIIIDDGDHAPQTQLRVLLNLWPFLNPGGLYVIEDVVPGASDLFVSLLKNSTLIDMRRLSGIGDSSLIVLRKEGLSSGPVAEPKPRLDGNVLSFGDSIHLGDTLFVFAALAYVARAAGMEFRLTGSDKMRQLVELFDVPGLSFEPDGSTSVDGGQLFYWSIDSAKYKGVPPPLQFLWHACDLAGISRPEYVYRPALRALEPASDLSNTVLCQFDSRFRPVLDRENVLKLLKKTGFTAFKMIGGPETAEYMGAEVDHLKGDLAFICRCLCGCACFVGCESGMQALAGFLGVRAYVTEDYTGAYKVFPATTTLVRRIDYLSDPPRPCPDLKNKILNSKLSDILAAVPKDVFAADIHKPGHEYILSGNNYEFYHAVAAVCRPSSILEIGVQFGYSLISLLKGHSLVEYVEGWDLETWPSPKNSLRDAASNIKKASPIQVVLRHMNSQKELKLPRFFDLVSIDGDHSYAGTAHDLELCLGSCSLAIVDDYSFVSDVKRAVDDFATKHAAAIQQHFLLSSDRGLYVFEFANKAGSAGKETT